MTAESAASGIQKKLFGHNDDRKEMSMSNIHSSDQIQHIQKNTPRHENDKKKKTYTGVKKKIARITNAPVTNPAKGDLTPHWNLTAERENDPVTV